MISTRPIVCYNIEFLTRYSACIMLSQHDSMTNRHRNSDEWAAACKKRKTSTLLRCRKASANESRGYFSCHRHILSSIPPARFTPRFPRYKINLIGSSVLFHSGRVVIHVAWRCQTTLVLITNRSQTPEFMECSSSTYHRSNICSDALATRPRLMR